MSDTTMREKIKTLGLELAALKFLRSNPEKNLPKLMS